MAKKRRYGDLTERSRDRIAREGARFGLTRRQSAGRYNRGTFNPLSRNEAKQIPKNAPFFPVATGRELKDRAMRNIDRIVDFDDPFEVARGVDRNTILDAVEHHASDQALIRMANASDAELKQWARYQKAYSSKGKKTPEWVRSLGWKDANGKWLNIFWYH